MFGMLSGSLVELTSSGAIPVADIARSSVAAAPDIDGIATRTANSLDILLWNYHDEDIPAPDAGITLTIAGLPSAPIHLTRYTMDAHHSNAYAAWLEMGSPQHPTPAQLATLEKSSGLQQTADGVTRKSDSPMALTTKLPRQAVMLFHLSW
jgi:xylan 1,4-beta-xylosidase